MTKFFSLILVVLKTFMFDTVACNDTKVMRRVGGGDEANYGEFAHAVLLRYEGRHICSGSILTSSWSLTVRNILSDITNY